MVTQPIKMQLRCLSWVLKIRQDALCTGQCHRFPRVRAVRILHIAPTEGTKHKKLGKQKGLGSGCSTLSYLQLVAFPSFPSSPLCSPSLEWEENIRSHPFKGDKQIHLLITLINLQECPWKGETNQKETSDYETQLEGCQIQLQVKERSNCQILSFPVQPDYENL